jgi:hypothetical protein
MIPKLLLILNAALIALNALMYWQNFRFARRSNRRLALLARQVRAEMEGGALPISCKRAQG